jgi:hypothetical protein
MPPRKRKQLTDDPTSVEAQAQIQQKLAEASAKLAEAKEIADASGLNFEFLDKTYVAKKTITTVTGGCWDDEDPDWMSSNC